MQGNNVVIENAEMYSVKVPKKNVTALHLEGTNFTLLNAFLQDN